MTEREFEQRLRAFYRAEVESAGPAADQLRDGVWAIPDEMPTRSDLFGTRRFVVLAAAAMLTVLLVGGAIAVGAGLLRWLDLDPSPSVPRPLIWVAQDESDVPGGTYVLDVDPSLRVTFTLPVGWERVRNDGLLWGQTKWITLMVVDNVYLDGCRLQRRLMDPPVGRTVDSLAAAISDVPGWHVTSVTDVVLDGHAGRRVELIGPADASSCVMGEWRLFHVAGSPGYFPAIRDSETMSVHILDVDGRRLVVVAGAEPWAWESVQAELGAVIDSIRIGRVVP